MRKLTCLLAAAILLLLLTACGGAEPDESVEMGNPLRAATAEQIEAQFGAVFSVPDNAEGVQYTIITGDAPIAELHCTVEGDDCRCRVQSADIPAEELPDISGMYFTWTSKASALVGYNEAVLTWNEGEEGVIRWYDYAPGLLYSVSLSSGATQARLEALAEALYHPAQGEADAATTAGSAVTAPAELTNLLASISQKYEPGVMGCSLRALRYAATLMDWFTANPVSEAEIHAAVLDFLSTLDTRALQDFPGKLEDVHNAAHELFGGDRAELLDSCGYEAQSDQWDEARMNACFDLIWEIVGKA